MSYAILLLLFVFAVMFLSKASTKAKEEQREKDRKELVSLNQKVAKLKRLEVLRNDGVITRREYFQSVARITGTDEFNNPITRKIKNERE